jgi:hypothetical protein
VVYVALLDLTPPPHTVLVISTDLSDKIMSLYLTASVSNYVCLFSVYVCVLILGVVSDVPVRKQWWIKLCWTS